MAITFLFSAISKLIPIEPFEITLVDIHVANWTLAPIIARIIIGLEFALALCLLINSKFTRRFILGSLFLTLVFSMYLLILIYVRGNEVNCGCFGNIIIVSPIHSLLKNAILVVLALLALRSTKQGVKSRWILIAVLSLVGFSIPFAANPLSSRQISMEEASYPLELEQAGFSQSLIDSAKFNAFDGNLFVPVLSASCIHCQSLAQKLTVLERQGEIDSVFAIIMGTEDQVNKFMKVSNSDFPYIIYDSHSLFKLNNGVFPTTFLIVDGRVQAKWKGDISGDYLREIQVQVLQ